LFQNSAAFGQKMPKGLEKLAKIWASLSDQVKESIITLANASIEKEKSN